MKKKPFKPFNKKPGKFGDSKFKKRTGKKPLFFRKKACKFCIEKIESVDYKDTPRLQKFITERGKVTPSRLSGLCATHQRVLIKAINRARSIAVLPYSARY